MSGTDILTNRGIEKIRDAAGSASQVQITDIALGDGNGQAYAPSPDQTTLRRELLRQPIETVHRSGENEWHVTASFAPDVAVTIIREVGFFDADGELIALWAGQDVGDNRRTGAVEFLIKHVLQFEGVADGLIVVNAPLDTYIDHAVVSLRTKALIIDHQLKLTKQMHDQSVGL